MVVWVTLAVANFGLHRLGFKFDAPYWFPISVFEPRFNSAGLPWLACFLGLTAVALWRVDRACGVEMWVTGLLLIVAGNLIQGSTETAFIQPFVGYDNQHYHEAVKIACWQEWLRRFNLDQPILLPHSTVHPPFAVLFAYLILNLGGHHVFVLAFVFILIASLSVPLIRQVGRDAGASDVQANRIALVFALIPAVNIYSGVSVDGVHLTIAAAFLWGLARTLRAGRLDVVGVVICVGTCVALNALTFLGLFVLATGGLIGLWEAWKHGRTGALLTVLISGLGLLAAMQLSIRHFGYDHISSLLTASRLENPMGPQIIASPMEYVESRLESICEMALFFSFGCLALWFHKNRLGRSPWSAKDLAGAISGSVFVVVGMLLVAGVFETGEAARACIFAYPFFVMTLVDTPPDVMRDVTILAALQTAGMQLFGWYFW